MKFRKTILASMILGAVMIGVSLPSASAEEIWVMKPVEKLGRGIANVAFGPLEILMKGYDVTQAQGGIAGLTYGALKGVSWTIAREVVGVIDIVTFPFPLPGCPDDPNDAGWGYGPIMNPPWVVDIEHNWANFVYNDSSFVSSHY